MKAVSARCTSQASLADRGGQKAGVAELFPQLSFYFRVAGGAVGGRMLAFGVEEKRWAGAGGLVILPPPYFFPASASVLPAGTL